MLAVVGPARPSIAVISDKNVLHVVDSDAGAAAHFGEAPRQVSRCGFCPPTRKKQDWLHLMVHLEEPGAVHMSHVDQLFQ